MRPPEGSPCPTRRPPEAASARRSPSRGPSGASPGPSAGRRTSSSEEGGLLRDTSCPWKKSSMTFSTGFYTPHPAARHSTPVLTMNVYSRASLLDVAGAVEGIGEMLTRQPSRPEPQEMRATGTDGRQESTSAGVPSDVPSRSARGGSDWHSGATLRVVGSSEQPAPETQKTPAKPGKNRESQGSERRGSGRSRTDDGGFAIRCLSHLATEP